MSTGKWVAADMPDQTGRVAVVTGANSGLGLVAARELARAGAQVILACRNAHRGQTAVESVRREIPGAKVELMRLDLADLAAIHGFVEDFTATYPGPDVLLNNAGVMALPRMRTADSFEMQFGTNHLGHFALTGLLLSSLRERPDARVVTVSSGLHRVGRIDFDDLQGERRYGKWKAYCQAKLANLLFAFELQRRLDRAGLPVRSLAAHPGYAATNLQLAAPRLTGSGPREWVMSVANRLFAQDMDRGALPSLYAATMPDLPGGTYIGPDGLFEQRGFPTVVRAGRAAYDEQTARRLWDVSEELTGVRYSFDRPTV